MKRRRILKGLALCAAACALLFLLSMAAIVADGLTDDSHRVDIAVVLGNEVKKDGRPSARLQARLQKALEIYQAGLAPVILVSGGVGKSGFDEATVMADWLAAHDVPRSRIIRDSEGVNTFATARNACRIMRQKGMKSALVVTQYFHVSRAKMAFRRFGISPVYGAHADIFEWRDLYSTPREAVGYASYLLRSK